MNYPRILSFDELLLSCHSIIYPSILSFDELSPFPVRSFICRNEQVTADEIQRETVYHTDVFSFCFV
jgi:hypothetical protein